MNRTDYNKKVENMIKDGIENGKYEETDDTKISKI